MADWKLVGRAGTRYTLVYGGGTAALVAAIGQELFLLGLVAIGLLLLLFVAGGTGTVRMGTAMANADSPGISGTTTDPTADEAFASAIEADLKLFFYAVGLLVFGFVGLVLVGSVA